MILWLFLCLVLHYVNPIPVGLIRNASLTLGPPSTFSTMNGTSEECICAMIASSNISALNYFSNTTCQLFSNASLTNAYYSLAPSVNSLIYFLDLPTKTVGTTKATAVPSSSFALSTEYKPTTTDLSTSNAKTSTYIATTITSAKVSGVSTMVSVIPPITVAGSGVAGPLMGQLNEPNDIFVTDNGTLYVADYLNYRIQIFGPTNTTAYFSQTGMGTPKTVCVDNTSNYYVIENASPNNRISKWPLNQTVLTLYNAYGMAMDSGRNLYLSTLSNTIVFWNATSGTTNTIVSASRGLNGSRHIHLDEKNQLLYIADSENNRIVKFYISVGNLTVVAGGNGAGSAANQLNFPTGVCVSQKDNAIYVADSNNNRIQRWAANGTVGVTVLGYANGTASNGAYGLNGPYSVFLNAAETFLYVADSDNNRVQRLSLI